MLTTNIEHCISVEVGSLDMVHRTREKIFVVPTSWTEILNTTKQAVRKSKKLLYRTTITSSNSPSLLHKPQIPQMMFRENSASYSLQ